MKVGCAKELTVSIRMAQEAEALELASMNRLVVLMGNIQQNTYTTYKLVRAEVILLYLFFFYIKSF